jgi:hypothetical protein
MSADLKTDVRLACTLRQEPAAIRLSYALKNGSGATVGLFNRIQGVHLDGRLNLSADVVYVDFVDGVLELAKRVLPVPEGLKVSERLMPHVTRLEAGQEFKEELVVPVPVAVNQPYRRALLAGKNPGADVVADKPVGAHTVLFSLGVFPIPAEMRLMPVSPAYPKIFHVWPPGPALSGQVVLTHRASLAAPVAVHDYRVVPPPV